MDYLTDIDIDGLVYMLSKMRGPGLIDPALPIDPDAERYPPGVREWANERLGELADERVRRNRRPKGGVATIIEDDGSPDA